MPPVRARVGIVAGREDDKSTLVVREFCEAIATMADLLGVLYVAFGEWRQVFVQRQFVGVLVKRDDMSVVRWPGVVRHLQQFFDLGANRDWRQDKPATDPKSNWQIDREGGQRCRDDFHCVTYLAGSSALK